MAFFVGLSKTAEEEKKKPVAVAATAPSQSKAIPPQGNTTSDKTTPPQNNNISDVAFLNVNRNFPGAEHVVGMIPKGTDTYRLPSGLVVPLDVLNDFGWDTPVRGSFTKESAAYWKRWSEAADEILLPQLQYFQRANKAGNWNAAVANYRDLRKRFSQPVAEQMFPGFKLPVQDIPADRYAPGVFSNPGNAPDMVYEAEVSPYGFIHTVTPTELRRYEVSNKAHHRNFASLVKRERHMLPADTLAGLRSIGWVPRVGGDNDIEDPRWGRGIENHRLMAGGGRFNIDSSDPGLGIAFRNEWLRRGYYKEFNAELQQLFKDKGKSMQSAEDWAGLKKDIANLSARLGRKWSPLTFDRTMSEVASLRSLDLYNQPYVPQRISNGHGISFGLKGDTSIEDIVSAKRQAKLRHPDKAKTLLDDSINNAEDPGHFATMDLLMRDLAPDPKDNSPMAWKKRMLIYGYYKALGRAADEKANDIDAEQYAIRGWSDGWTPAELQMLVRLATLGKYRNVAHLLTGETGDDQFKRLYSDAEALYGADKAAKLAAAANLRNRLGMATGTIANAMAAGKISAALPTFAPMASGGKLATVANAAANIPVQAYKGVQSSKMLDAVGNALSLAADSLAPDPRNSNYDAAGNPTSVLGAASPETFALASGAVGTAMPMLPRALGALRLPLAFELSSAWKDPNYVPGGAYMRMVDALAAPFTQISSDPWRTAASRPEHIRRLEEIQPELLEKFNPENPKDLNKLVAVYTKSTAPGPTEYRNAGVMLAAARSPFAVALMGDPQMDAKSRIDVLKSAIGRDVIESAGYFDYQAGIAQVPGLIRENRKNGDQAGTGWSLLPMPNIRLLAQVGMDKWVSGDIAGQLQFALSKDSPGGEYNRSLCTAFLNASLRDTLSQGGGSKPLSDEDIAAVNAITGALKDEDLDRVCEPLYDYFKSTDKGNVAGVSGTVLDTLKKLDPRLITALTRNGLYAAALAGETGKLGGNAGAPSTPVDLTDVPKEVNYAISRGLKQGLGAVADNGLFTNLKKLWDRYNKAGHGGGSGVPASVAGAVGSAVSDAAKKNPDVLDALLDTFSSRGSGQLGQAEIGFILGLKPEVMFQGMNGKNARRLLSLVGGGDLHIDGTPEQKEAVRKQIDAIKAAAEQRVLSLTKEDPVNNLPLLAGLFLKSKGFGDAGEFLSDPFNFYVSAATLLAGGAGLSYFLFSGDDEEEDGDETEHGKLRVRRAGDTRYDDSGYRNRIDDVLAWKKTYEG